MAGDFTQGASLTRLCQRTCHLQQTCQLTRMEFGIETDQFPNCQARRGSDSVTLFCQVEEKKEYFLFGMYCQLFSLFSSSFYSAPRARFIPGCQSQTKWACECQVGHRPGANFFFSALTLLPLLIFLPHRAVIAVYVHCLIMALIALAIRPHFSIAKPDTQSIFPLQSSFLLCFVTTIVSISRLSKPHLCVSVEPLSMHVFGMVSKL